MSISCEGRAVPIRLRTIVKSYGNESDCACRGEVSETLLFFANWTARARVRSRLIPRYQASPGSTGASCVDTSRSLCDGKGVARKRIGLCK